MVKFYVDTLNNQKISEAIQQAAFDAGYGWMDNTSEICKTYRFIFFRESYLKRFEFCLSHGSEPVTTTLPKFTIEQAIEWFKENPRTDGAETIRQWFNLQSELAKLKQENEKLNEIINKRLLSLKDEIKKLEKELSDYKDLSIKYKLKY